MAVVKKFGDEHSNLLDQYERVSFEARLKEAMLGRSLSEPRTMRSQPQLLTASVAVGPPYNYRYQDQPRKATFNFNKIINKLLKPILHRKSRARATAKKEFPDFKNPMSWKALSKSMRL